MGAPADVRHEGSSPELSVAQRQLRAQDLPAEVGFLVIAVSCRPGPCVTFLNARSQQYLSPAMVPISGC